MSNIALCKCGIDMSKHDNLEHAFDAAGTKYRCSETEIIEGFFCPRPAYHDEEGVACGPLTGEKLWD